MICEKICCLLPVVCLAPPPISKESYVILILCVFFAKFLCLSGLVDKSICINRHFGTRVIYFSENLLNDPKYENGNLQSG